MSTEIYGLDVSKYQGDIDWEKVRSAGKKFVMIRVGWCGYDGKIEDNGGLDSTFHTNVTGALAAGLAVGVYVYSYATTPDAATVAAIETLALVKDYALAYPVAFDMEDTANTKYDANTKDTNNAIARAFLSKIKEGGLIPILYTYKSFAESYLALSELSDYDFWLAHYTEQTDYTGSYTIWQYTGSGTCDGVSTEVDLNISYKDYASLPGTGTDSGEDNDNSQDETNPSEDNNSGESPGNEDKDNDSHPDGEGNIPVEDADDSQNQSGDSFWQCIVSFFRRLFGKQ